MRLTFAAICMCVFLFESVASAQPSTVFEATSGNTTTFDNAVNGGEANRMVVGAAPDLDFVLTGGNFFVGGFAGVESINDLNGTAVTALDQVTMTLTIDSIDLENIQLRSRGIEFGLAGEPVADGSEEDSAEAFADNLILRLGGAGNGVPVTFGGNSAAGTPAFPDPEATNDFDEVVGILREETFQANGDDLLDGFTVTLTANAAGYTFSFTSVNPVTANADNFNRGNGVVEDVTGTFEPGEFERVFGGGHFHLAAQTRNVPTNPSGAGIGTATINISEASITVGVAPGPDLTGDFNDDGAVDCDDIDEYIGNLGFFAAGGLEDQDLVADGTIDSLDVAFLVENLIVTTNGETGTFLGDLNCDGIVDVLGDAFILVGSLGSTVMSYSDGDANLDGTVDVLNDAFALVGNLGMNNTPPAAP